MDKVANAVFVGCSKLDNDGAFADRKLLSAVDEGGIARVLAVEPRAGTTLVTRTM